MKKEIVRERPFEYLKRRDGNGAFDKETVGNWYIARAYVLDRLKEVSFAPGSSGHLHVVIEGDSPLMLSVLRQVCLSAHYPNYEEYDSVGNLSCRNRTVITLISQRASEGIIRELEKEEYLCNLLRLCRHSVFGDVKNEGSYLDVEVEITGRKPESEGKVWIKEDDIKDFLKDKDADDVFSVDTRKALFASRVYCLGSVIDNLPYESINSPGRYNRALATFQSKVLEGNRRQTLVSSQWDSDSMAVKRGLSNIACADCFESKENSIKALYPHGRKIGRKEVMGIWEKYNDALSCSEHGRWVVEKLIMGYRPLDISERLRYGSLFGKSRSAYSRQLKDNPADSAHIDICSFRDLRRIDPDNMKYDSFLMLAIPLILDNIRRNN